MNKKLYSLMLSLLALAGFVSSCSDTEDIVFDHERQHVRGVSHTLLGVRFGEIRPFKRLYGRRLRPFAVRLPRVYAVFFVFLCTFLYNVLWFNLFLPEPL